MSRMVSQGSSTFYGRTLNKNSMDLRDNHVHSVGRVEGFALVVQKLTWNACIELTKYAST